MFLCLLGCEHKRKSIPMAPESVMPLNVTSPKLQLLLMSNKSTYHKGESMIFVVAILNGTKKPVVIDDRMVWPPIIYLEVCLPDGEKMSASHFGYKASWPDEKDMLTLAPGGMHGTVITLDDYYLIPELRKPTVGRYTFQASYYSRIPFYDPGEKIPPQYSNFELESNSISVNIK